MKTSIFSRLLPIGLFSMVLAVSGTVYSQNEADKNSVVVSGVVLDAATGTPMAGVRVTAYNNALHSAMSHQDGSFSIEVPDYVSSLTFAVDGCNTVVSAIGSSKDNMEIKMYSDAFSEIYSASTVASSTISAQIAGTNADLSIDQQLQRSLQGSVLSTIRSGQLAIGAAMQIDGISSLNISSQPLVVLDGTILDMGYDNQTMHDGFYNNLLANIPIEDIASINILKNGVGIYGAKGANGVIIINTNRNRSMATKIDVNLSGNFQTMPKFPSMMDASQYRTYASELLGTVGTKINKFKFLDSDSKVYYNMYHQDTDWSEIAYRSAFVQNYNVNVQGGDEIANYNLSMGYAMGDGVLEESEFSRFSLRLNSDIDLSEKLKLRFDASYSDITRDLRDDGANDNIDNSIISSPGFLALAKSPFLSPYAFDYEGRVSKNYLADEDDYLAEVLGDEVSLANPLSILEAGDGLNKNYFGNRFISLSVTPKWIINRYWSLSEHFSYMLTNADENYYFPLSGTPSYRIDGIGLVENKAAAMNAKHDGFMSDTYIAYARRFAKHNVDFQAGVRYSNNSLYQTSMTGYNSGNDKTPNMTASLKYKKTDGIDMKDIGITWWAQGNYNLAEKYYLSASMGLSASSRFGDRMSGALNMFGMPWGLFPSVSAAWVASNESWFNVDFVDYLKLNAGFDYTGNDNFDSSASKTYFSPVRVLQMNGITLANIGNKSLKWETTKKFTAGLNMALFDNRLSVSANMFKSSTDNLLSISELSYLSGKREAWTNSGALENMGFDAGFGVKIMNSDLIKWEAGVMAGHYKNTVTSLPDETIDNTLYGATVRTQVGGPVGVFYGYRTNGVFSTAAQASSSGLGFISETGSIIPFEAGDMIFNDKDGNGLIDEKDMEVIGDPNPDLYGRIYTNLNVRNFSLSATMTFSIGGDIYNYQRMLLESGSRFMNQTVAVCNRWTAEGQVTDMPKVVFQDPHGNARFSDRWIEDGSYLRLQNVTLSYRIPISSLYLQGLTVWGSANNLFTLTKYLGSDPEFSCSNNILTRGIDRGLVPQTANFSLGLKINL